MDTQGLCPSVRSFERDSGFPTFVGVGGKLLQALAEPPWQQFGTCWNVYSGLAPQGTKVPRDWERLPALKRCTNTAWIGRLLLLSLPPTFWGVLRRGSRPWREGVLGLLTPLTSTSARYFPLRIR